MTVRRRRFLATSAALATPLVAGCTGGDGGGGEPVEVALVDFAFEPGTDAPIEVDAGTTVRFVWESGPHNIHVDSQPADADWPGHESTEDAGFEHEHTFDVSGQYHFWCVPHRGLGMVGDLVVAESGGRGGVY